MSSSSSLVILVFITFTTCLLNTPTLAQNGMSNSTPSIFTFGDSYADPGNNNFILTLQKANFRPYGIDFPGKIPTGRFSNGLLLPDQIAKYAGIKPNIPAYLDPTVSMNDFQTGVGFASGGSGYDPFTAARAEAIPLSKQLENFDEYKKKLENMVGKERAKDIVENGIYIISSGTNDVVYTYGFVRLPILSPNVPTYLQYLLGKFREFLQGLKDRGARKILVLNVPPTGCLPVVITFQSPLLAPRRCVESVTSIASQLNQLIQAEINAMQAASPPNQLVAYGDYFGSVNDQINNPQTYGLEVVNRGCCGVGVVEEAFLCNPLSPVCSNRTTHVFWDSIHPTQTSFTNVFQSLRPVLDMLLQK